eukprot:Skav219006  [mRNA]  locus=scaffold169:548979:553415:- [translate_table: standard]
MALAKKNPKKWHAAAATFPGCVVREDSSLNAAAFSQVAEKKMGTGAKRISEPFPASWELDSNLGEGLSLSTSCREFATLPPKPTEARRLLSRRNALLYPRCHQFQKRTRMSAPS